LDLEALREAGVIVPTRTFRRLVNARRGNPLARPARPDVKAAFEAAKKRWGDIRNHWVAGWDVRKDERIAMERAADAIMTTQPPSEFDLDTLAACERMLHGGSTLIDVFADRFGPAAALRIKMRSHDWAVTSGRKDHTWWWMLSETRAPQHAVDLGWRALRVATALASDEAYAEARELAAKLRAESNEAVKRIPLDWAFPSEVEWALADAKAALASPDFPKLTYVVAPLIASLADEDVIVEFVRKCNPRQAVVTLQYACDVVVALAPDASVRVLSAMLDATLGQKQWDETEMHKLATALTSIESEAVAKMLSKWVRHARFGRHVVGYFETHAELAKAALTDLARGKSITADEVRAIVEGHQRAARPDEGSMDDAPAMLRAPPWLTRRERPVLALERLPYLETIAWVDHEREKLAETPAVQHGNAVIRAPTNEELAEFDALPEGQKYVDVWPRWQNKQWLVLDLPDERRLAMWNKGKARLYQRAPLYMLARFGDAAYDGLFARDPFDGFDDRMLTAALRIDSPRSALVAARVMMRRRPWRARAKAWLLEHAEPAAIALIPAAFGRETRARRVAERALRFLAVERPVVVRDVATRMGSEAGAATEELVFGDPLARLVVRGKPPRWLRVEALPTLVTKDGRTLPRAATHVVLDVLRSRGIDVAYAGIAELKRTLDATSLADFAWALFTEWNLHGRRRMHDWMALGVGAFGTDSSLARLEPYVHDWTQSDPRACVTLVDVLTAIGTPAAMLELTTIQSGARAPVLVLAVNEALGPTSEAHADLGLDVRGEAVLDLGARKVRVVLDESLVPMIALEDGRRVPQVPRAAKNDDPAKVAAAVARFNRLRRESKMIAKIALRRLERAMIGSRRFSIAELETKWIRDPLVGQAARRLVWGIYDGGALAFTFRVVEDGTYADADDMPLLLDPTARTGVVHPLDLDDATLARWGTLFADYEILQPFEQLGRAVFRGTPKEAESLLKSTQGRMVEARALLKTLVAHGWDRPAGRRFSSAWRELATSRTATRAVLTFAPGISLDTMRTAPPQKLAAINTPNTTLDALTRIDLSELVRTAITLGA
jgi:hypothetical protein